MLCASSVVLLLLAFIFPLASLAHDPPFNITILATEGNCSTAIPVTVQPSYNNSGIDFLYDTRTTISGYDSLASRDSTSSHESLCYVCTTFTWYELIIGEMKGVDYDFTHRLDNGLVAEVNTTIIRPHSSNGKPYNQTLYYEPLGLQASGDTLQPRHVHTHQAKTSLYYDQLDPYKQYERICTETTFRVVSNAGSGIGNGSGEISKRGVFTQTVDITWTDERPER